MTGLSNTLAEKAVISTICHKGSEALKIAESKIVTSMAFTNHACRAMYHIFLRMRENGTMSNGHVGASEMLEMLQGTPASDIGGPKAETVLDYAGGHAGVLELLDGFTSMSNFARECSIIDDCWRRRKTLRAIDAAKAKLNGTIDSTDTIVASMHEEITRLGSGSTSSLSVEQCIQAHLERVECERAAGDAVATWAIKGMDSLIPLKSGRYIVVAARPGQGKTTLGLQMAAESAEKGVKTTFISMEISNTDAGKKLLESGYQGIDNLRVAPGQSLNPETLRSVVKRSVGEGSRLIVVDYVQIVKAQYNGQTEYERVSAASSVLMEAARDEDVCIVGLAQLKRDVESGAKVRAPRLSDLKGSGGLEQDAAAIVFIHSTTKKSDLHAPTNLIVEKNRFGQVDTVETIFDKPGGRFLDQKTPTKPKTYSEKYKTAPTDDEALFI